MLLLLPQPGQPSPVVPCIKAPSEESFTGTFGRLLPPATFLPTSNGGLAAFYTIGKASSARDDGSARILMIHGVQTPALGLLPLANAIQARFPTASIVLVDLYGHGLSSTPIVTHTPALFHHLISTLLEHIGWSSAHIMGYSFGGSLLAGYLSSYPDKVQSAVFIAPAGLMTSSTLDRSSLAILTGQQEDEDGSKIRDWVFNFLEDGDLIVPPDWKERVSKGEVVGEAIRDWELKHHAGYQASVISIVRHGGVFDNHEAFRQVAKTSKEHLIVLGENDEVASRSECEEVGITNVRVVKDAGHSLVRTNVAEVADLVEEFYKSDLGLTG